MTVDPALYRRLQERSDRLERQARILGDAFHRFAEELAGLGRDLAQLEESGQEPPPATPRRRGPARAQSPAKTCTVCGQKFTRRPSERPADSDRRQTCGRPDCRREAISRGMKAKRAARRAEAPSEPAPEEPPPPEPPRVEPTPHRFSWQPPERHETVTLQPLGEPCPKHPGEVIGAFGCPACNAGKRWLERSKVAQVGVGSRP